MIEVMMCGIGSGKSSLPSSSNCRPKTSSSSKSRVKRRYKDPDLRFVRRRLTTFDATFFMIGNPTIIFPTTILLLTIIQSLSVGALHSPQLISLLAPGSISSKLLSPHPTPIDSPSHNSHHHHHLDDDHTFLKPTHHHPDSPLPNIFHHRSDHPHHHDSHNDHHHHHHHDEPKHNPFHHSDPKDPHKQEHGYYKSHSHSSHTEYSYGKSDKPIVIHEVHHHRRPHEEHHHHHHNHPTASALTHDYIKHDHDHKDPHHHDDTHSGNYDKAIRTHSKHIKDDIPLLLLPLKKSDHLEIPHHHHHPHHYDTPHFHDPNGHHHHTHNQEHNHGHSHNPHPSHHHSGGHSLHNYDHRHDDLSHPHSEGHHRHSHRHPHTHNHQPHSYHTHHRIPVNPNPDDPHHPKDVDHDPHHSHRHGGHNHEKEHFNSINHLNNHHHNLDHNHLNQGHNHNHGHNGHHHHSLPLRSSSSSSSRSSSSPLNGIRSHNEINYSHNKLDPVITSHVTYMDDGDHGPNHDMIRNHEKLFESSFLKSSEASHPPASRVDTMNSVLSILKQPHHPTPPSLMTMMSGSHGHKEYDKFFVDQHKQMLDYHKDFVKNME